MTMRSQKVLLGLGVLMLLAQRMAPATPELSERVLLDAPRGAWVASVRADAALTILQEKDGWRKVRLEGWTTTEPGGALTAAPAIPAAPTTTPGATVKGVLVPLPGQQPDTPGAGLLVLLVSGLERVGAEHRTLGEECREGALKREARIADLEAVLRTALNSSDNFTAAAKAHDKAKAELAAARRDRTDYVEGCRGRADALFEGHTVKRAISDGRGAFEFSEVSAGAYWVVAGDHRGGTARAWWLDCRVSSQEAVILDPRAAAPVGDPYWGLR
jgi:hypothetical protein